MPDVLHVLFLLVTAQPLAVVYPNPVDPAVLTVHRVCRYGTLAARLTLLFIYVFLTSLLQSWCACLRGSSCSSEAAQVSHVTSLAGKHVALNINGDEVTIYEASGDATAAVQQGSTRKEQPKVCGCMCAGCRVAQLACAKSCVSMPSAVQGCVLVPCARFSVKSYEAYWQCAQKHGAPRLHAHCAEPLLQAEIMLLLALPLLLGHQDYVAYSCACVAQASCIQGAVGSEASQTVSIGPHSCAYSVLTPSSMC